MHSTLYLGNNVDRLVFSQDIEFTKNRAYRAAAISFFLHPELPLKYPDIKDAVHAGRMAIFKRPVNFKELCLPPCVGEGAHTEEEQAWCTATISYLVDNLDANGRQSRESQKVLCLGGRVLATPRPRPPPPTPVPPPPPARGLARAQRRQRPKDEAAPAASAAARAQVQFVHARVRGPRWRKPPRTSCTPNRTMMSCRLPNPRVGRG